MTPRRSIPEVVIPVSRQHSSAGRSTLPSSLSSPSKSGSKRVATSSNDLGSPPAKRLRSSAEKSRSASSIYTRSSIEAARTTPTKIAIPRARDANGPSYDERDYRQQDSRKHSTVASTSARSSARISSLPVKEWTPSTLQKKPAFSLPGKRQSSRKKAAISDLMSRANAPAQTVVPDSEGEDDVDELAIPVPAADSSKARVSDSKTTSSLETQVIKSIDGFSDTSIDSDGEDEDMVPLKPVPADIITMPSPAPSSSTSVIAPVPAAEAHPEPVGTPTKSKKGSEALKTPSKPIPPLLAASESAKKAKRTPTKAVKSTTAEALASTSLVLPEPEATILPSYLPTPSSTPERSSSRQTPYAKEEVLQLLDTVLGRLSGPCASLSFSEVPKDNSADYRNWLATRPCLSRDHEVAEKDVRTTMDRTIREGEGNCLLLVGERGIGKTAIVDRSLKVMGEVFGEDGFIAIRLSGLVQKDDKAALKEVARQLCSSAYIDDTESSEGASFTSNATILSSLLAMLEPGPSDTEEEAESKSKPLIFVIDEFDLFAHHSVRQSFLYCLLDCVQGGFRRGGMAVLGLSARADCIETLEKRVKSRCQSRVHHLLPGEDIFTGTAKLLQATMSFAQPEGALQEIWNEGLQAFFSSKNVQVQLTAMNELRGLDADRKVFDVFTFLLSKLHASLGAASTAQVPTARICLQAADLLSQLQYQERNIPSSLSVVEVAMLIASKHIVEEERALNFVIAYDRYLEHTKRAAASGSSSTRAFSRSLCQRAFERLRTLGIIRDVASGARSASSNASIFKLCRLVPWPNTIEEAIKERKDIPQHLVKWCKAWSE